AALLAVPALYKSRWHRLCLAALLLAMLSLTASQSSQLASVLAVIFFFAFPCNRRAAWAVLGAALCLLVLAAPFVAIWMFAHMAQDVNAMPFFGAGGGFGGQRLEIWDFVS